MYFELIIFLSMVAVFMIGCFVFKLPVGVSMVLAALTGTLVSGNGIPFRHLVEGTFGYIDTILVISTAMIFMKAIEKSGTLNALSSFFINRFHSRPALLLITLMFIVMFPGMITGSSTAAVLTAGSLVAPVLIMLGIPAVNTAAIIAIGGMMGMIAPPVNVPVMIIGGGIDMPYVGFGIPLLLMTIPISIFTVLFLGLKPAKEAVKSDFREKLEIDLNHKYSPLVYLPLALVILLMVVSKAAPGFLPNLGLPLIFMIGSVASLFCGEKFSPS